jgi:hypothetical protein
MTICNDLDGSSSDRSGVIGFEYCNSQGEIKNVNLIGWRESGRYLLGRCLEDGKFKTYRIDRIQKYFGDVSAFLTNPIQLPPPKLPSRSSTTSDGFHVCFTGFKASEKNALEARADTHGLIVVQSVTRDLKFLVCGSNAGPKKIEQARDRSVYILNATQFELFIETGELPDDQIVMAGSRGLSERLENPSLEFETWHYKIEKWHWNAFGVRVRPSVKAVNTWSRMPQTYDFHEGDVFYDSTNHENALQVTYNSEDGALEIHEIFGKRQVQGFHVTEEQFAIWLETGIRPKLALSVYRGNSKSGALMWRLSDS